jgi:Tfp pilus assembly PilM family ATPase
LNSLAGSHVAKIPDPLSIFPSGKEKPSYDSDKAAPEIAVATGLALRGMKRHG